MGIELEPCPFCGDLPHRYALQGGTHGLAAAVLSALNGKKLATAESITGGGIGSALTSIPGASNVYLGGVISYDSRIKSDILGVSENALETLGAVSASVAQMMASGVRKLMGADIGISVTGLAGPDGDEFGHEVGTVFIGIEDADGYGCREYHFSGSREEVRSQVVEAALRMVYDRSVRYS